MDKTFKKLTWWGALLTLALSTVVLPNRATAQDDPQDDPPTRVARLGYIEGSVSMQPAGEEEWVQAASNRPLTTGDKVWADQGSKAELQLGSATIRLSENTGFSFLNLDDRTVQIQLTSGTLNVRVRRLDRDDAIEIDTPNLAFNVDGPGNYRLEASEDGTYSIVTLRDGQGEATGNGQTYTIHSGQRATFNGTDSLNADVEQIGNPDQFDTWTEGRDRRWDNSRSAHYLSQDVVGYEDLDDNGDWRDDSNYGHVWYPRNVEAGWAPYHQGHWDWIAPWGYTWVDDSSWGYAPFHYGRWLSVGGRWGWIAGPPEVRAVYAPALVVFLGGGPGGFGDNVGWFPLGPREVYVPPYQVSRGYMNQVNISNTNVSTTNVTNIYNTTIINKSTTITNVNYANRGVQGAVTVVPQRAFAGAQPVARSAVAVNAQQLSRASISARGAAVAPTRQAVLGAHAASAGRVSAPPAAVANRQVIAKRTPPPPPVSFAKQQQAMSAHPGQPLPRREVQAMRPAASAQAHPAVKVAPPGKPAQPTTGHPNAPAQNAGRPGQPNQPGNQQNGGRPGQPNQPNQPGNPNAGRPGQPNQPNNQPGAANPNRPGNEQNRPGQPNQPNERPGMNNPNRPTGANEQNRPGQPNQPNQPNRPPANEQNHPGQPNQPNERPGMNNPNHPPAANEQNRPGQPNQPNQPNRSPGNEQNHPGQPNQPNERPGMNNPNRPPAANEQNRPGQPNQANQPNRPPANEQNRPGQPNQPNRPEPPANRQPAAQPNRPEPPANRPPAAQPNRPEPQANRPPAAQPAPRPQPPAQHPPAEARPAPPPSHPPAKTPEERKKEEEQKKPPVV